ncbi:hypothetical protein CC1G_15020 [Coprinopsis cinerea okayama7|uniref:Uncharacterized protein n=1 Tax=Coprinopsis cinerea (strain Okayama-7 / 130 / ATCC MYA-4618 / FGSC 9003) TaxID=240176 RepID=D6RPC7_COPC7|nr:hypothetical protein CC1G_15020 [Coprinopsis cinerea okayama7\|eukprot:XP_002910689.1 hypothetical protein CC1G_15020 [Coprinopsis cinerea okayama7\
MANSDTLFLTPAPVIAPLSKATMRAVCMLSSFWISCSAQHPPLYTPVTQLAAAKERRNTLASVHLLLSDTLLR